MKTTVTHWLPLGCALALAVTLTGCGDNGSTTPPATPTAPTTPAVPTTDMSVTTAPAMTAPAMTPAASMPAMAPTTPAAPAMATTTPAETTSAADKLITQGIDYVKNNKLDLAQQALAKLKEMKPSLPAEYGPKIDELQTMLDAAQVGAGKLPGGLKMPG